MKDSHVKTLFESLRKLVEDPAAINFIADIEQEYEDLEDVLEDAESDVSRLEDDIEEKDRELRNIEDTEPDFKTIDCGIGKIYYKADSLPLQSQMDDFVSAIRHKHTGSSVLY